MAKPYSMDLRERALSRVEAGESVRSVAETLSISPVAVRMAVRRLRKLYGEDKWLWLATVAKVNRKPLAGNSAKQ